MKGLFGYTYKQTNWFMKTRIVPNKLIIWALPGLFIACQSISTVEPLTSTTNESKKRVTSYRLKEIADSYSNVRTHTTTFEYKDGLNMSKSFYKGERGDLSVLNEFTHDETGRMTAYKKSSVPLLATATLLGELTTFANTASTIVATRSLIFKNNTPTAPYTGTYDTYETEYKFTNGLLTRVNYWRVGVNGHRVVLDEFDYTYTNGNITKLVCRLSGSVSEITYEYDNKLNPLYGLAQSKIGSPYGGTSIVQHYSRNNLVRVNGNDGIGKYGNIIISETFTYTYNEQGLPVKVINANDYATKTSDYKYETY